MGLITDRIDKIFIDFKNHHDYIKLIEDILEQNHYSFNWQQNTFNSYIKEKLTNI